MAVTPTIRKTRADLRRRVRDELQTASGTSDHWSDDMLNEDLNDSSFWVQMKMAKLGEQWYSAQDTFELNGSDYGIKLPSDLIREHLFYKKDSSDSGELGWTKLDIVPPQHLDRYETDWPRVIEEPSSEKWYLQGGELRARTRTPPSGTYRLTYFRRVKDLQDDQDVSEVPIEYHDLVVARTALRAGKRVLDGDRIMVLKEELNDLLREMYEAARNRSMSQEYSIEDSMDWGAG